MLEATINYYHKFTEVAKSQMEGIEDLYNYDTTNYSKIKFFQEIKSYLEDKVFLSKSLF